jgi:hypothetical protein
MMTAARQRKAQRVVHLAAALVPVGYLYAPLEAQLQDAVRFVVLPVLVVTGIAMWQGPRIRRLRKNVTRTADRPRRSTTREQPSRRNPWNRRRPQMRKLVATGDAQTGSFAFEEPGKHQLARRESMRTAKGEAT